MNQMYNAFSYSSLKEDQFRCLVFVQSLRPMWYAEIRLKLLSILDKKPDVKLHNLGHEYNFRSLIAENNPMPQPQTQQTYPISLSINQDADFVTVFISIKIVPSLNISARIAIRVDARRDSARAVNDDSI
ncbi:unnamed protein product [Hymenolepis diminuta]|uniref:Uncharacterized protein n=1 Tax=Hymenolepis diminuta TaxID=6216 RepID=A0A564YEG3_HYMDI|nr:unnamed protein product [Hymenolepis diminuta]